MVWFVYVFKVEVFVVVILVRIVGGISSGISVEVVVCSLRSGVDCSSRVVDGIVSSFCMMKERRVGRSCVNEGSE